MDFQIRTKDFKAALRQILQGQKADSTDLVDMIANRETLIVLNTGGSIQVPIETKERGSFSIPIGVLIKMKRVSGTYQHKSLRIRINEGRFRLEGMSVSNPKIKPRNGLQRVIDTFESASPAVLARKAAPQGGSAFQWLELGFEQWRKANWIEVYKCFMAAIEAKPNDETVMMWLGRLCELSTGFSYESLPFAYEDGAKWYAKAAMLGQSEAQYQHGQALLRYRYEFGEGPNPEQINLGIEWLRKAAIQGHGRSAIELAAKFARGFGVEANLSEALFWYEQAEAAGLCRVEEVLETMRRERRMSQCQTAVEAGDKAAFLYVEWADRSQFEFFIGWNLEMFAEETMSKYRRQFPDRALGDSPWWEISRELAPRCGSSFSQ